ncbi:MAG: hypothetical protein A2539_07515 [Elusimicrobia bacterium RIFOXYD2_FULL_34_15]|nr:MAG: hypothetical protein A2539_07515 [Elusimicrobia bacterium RIFOXYD2_FULL_34_15]
MVKKLLLMVFCLLIVVGCGKKESDQGKVTIRFSNAETVVDQIKIMKEITAEFEKENPDIKVKLEWGVRPEKILTELAAGTAPDVFMWWMGLDDLKERNALYPMGDFVKKYNIDLSKYFQCIVKQYTYDGQLYAFPLQLKTLCLVYNKDMFDKNKIAYPNEKWTWDDYLDAATKLTATKAEGGVRKQFGTLLPPGDQWIMLNGGNIIDVKNKKCVIDSPQGKEALEFLMKLNIAACPSQAELAAFTGRGGSEPFLSGMVAMVPAPTWMLSSLAYIKNFEWAVAPIPKPPKRKITYMFDDAGLVLAKNSKHPEEAFRFISFYCGKKGMEIFAKGRNGIPVYKEIAYSTFVTPPPDGLQYYLEAAEKATVPLNPRIKNYSEMRSFYSRNWTLALLGKLDLNTALKNIKDGMNEKLKDIEASSSKKK